MRKITLLSLVAATVLFTACGEETKKAATDAATAATETVKETTSNAVDATKAAASEAAEAAKAKASEVAAAAKAEAEKVAAAAADKATELKEAAATKAADAAAALKERAAATTEAAKEAASNAVDSVKETASAAVSDNAAGKAAFAKCAGCHGADGKTKALGKSAIIAGESAADLESKLAAYKAGTRNVAGMGMLMKGQVAAMSDEDIKAVSEYISSL